LALAPNAMRSIDRLILNRRIPPAIEEENITGELQVQSHRSGPIAHQQQVGVRVILEPGQDRLALFGWYAAVVDQRVTAFHTLLDTLIDPVNRLCPLGK